MGVLQAPKSLTLSRTEISADRDWKFTVGDPDRAESPTFDDDSWQTLSVPHDWSINGRPDAGNPTGADGGYFPAGVGWYRKSFTAPSGWEGRRVTIEFEGVSGDTTVYLNGQKLGVHRYAYTSFRFDLSSNLNVPGRNVLAVRVDNSLQPNGRWYSGSGIFRHVRVIVTDPIHIAPWGVFVSTSEATADCANLLVTTKLQNQSSEACTITLKTVVLGPQGDKNGEVTSTVELQADGKAAAAQKLTVEHPALWSPESPSLYRVITQIMKDGKVLDEVETPFGIRSLGWSVEKGLLLNGVPIKLAGGSVHHDNGPLGAAAFDRAEERKVELLKSAGFNAVRSAHNPPSSAFLDACDRLGLLVIDELFDVWTVSKRWNDYARFFTEWWRQDVDATVKRDRNHPSIILWAIGNEIPEVWVAEGAPIARQLASRVRALDPTRPITQAFPGATYGPHPDAAIAEVDIAGYNYNLAQNQSEDHRRVPTRIMMTTESFPADVFEQWELVQDHPYIVGEFVWTAMDYLGESGIGAWSYGEPQQTVQLEQMKSFLRMHLAKMGADGKNPMVDLQNGLPPNPLFPGFPWHGSYCGDLDLTGLRKPVSYYRDILWNGGDRVFAAVRLPEREGKKILAAGWAVYPSLPSWTWPGQEVRPLTVEVYSSVEHVRVLLNGNLIGEKSTGREEAFRAEFEIPYASGTLKVEGVRAGRVVAEFLLQTTSDPVRLRLTPDREVLKADGQDLAFVAVEAVDTEGRLQMSSNPIVHFEITGAGTIAGVGNGDTQSKEPYSGTSHSLFRGRALIVLRSSCTPGQITLTAGSSGLVGDSVVVQSKETPIRELE